MHLFLGFEDEDIEARKEGSLFLETSMWFVFNGKQLHDLRKASHTRGLHSPTLSTQPLLKKSRANRRWLQPPPPPQKKKKKNFVITGGKWQSVILLMDRILHNAEDTRP